MEAISIRQLLDRFADAIEADGISAVPSELMIALVDVARSVDASPIAIAVLVDPTEPEVARERAFCRVAIQVIGRSGRIDSRADSLVASGIPQPA
ncbi:MAG TPA: hypothetical protein VES40_09975 [Ilumatobacteraceae bacterium]|nr:hypothetical protein [Ilumatobacteraceae bacterium]